MFRTKKWALVSTLLMLAALILGACGAPASTGTGTSATTPAGSPAASAAPSPAESPAASASAAPAATTSAGGAGKVEIFSWWTGPGEEEGKLAMYEIFKQRNPGIEIVDATVTGGAGANAKTVLATRMAGNQPPDSFQVHAGQELVGTYVVAGKMEPITQLFKDEGWDKVMPKLLLDQITYQGEIYSVPVNIHRSNVLWYNKKIFDDNQLTPPKTMDEFFTVAEALKAKNITPLAIGGGDKFATPHLFESVLLASFGADDYAKLFQDDTMWADERTAQAIETFGRMLSYANADRGSLKWQDAAGLVYDGKAAMTIMGDWAEGYFKGRGGQPNVEFGWAASPGTDGIFMWLSDSFGLPKNAPNRDAAIAWLKVAGSKEGQDAFNPKKGSIPARTDADLSLYDAYLQYSIQSFAKDKLAPSIEHGAAAPTDFVTEYENAINVFAADQDVQTLVDALSDAASLMGQ
ncbi:MAG TPA: extracellular solute-binding protein [Herpetosiphonaceae bacterium]